MRHGESMIIVMALLAQYAKVIVFDGENDIVMINDGKARVYRYDSTIWRSKNVSKQVPYCFLAAHLCCDAHKAFTTFNYSTKTIYIETHYGSGDINTIIRQFQKIGEEWKEVIPVTPSYIINKDYKKRLLSIRNPLNHYIATSTKIWCTFCTLCT